MNAAALLRSKIQASLAPYLQTELEFRPYASPDLVASGIPELDTLVGGGLPRGALTEVCGPVSSGRTSLVYSVLAQMTQKQEVCAFVDVSDALDPESMASAGVDLTRILWVRCGEAKASDKVDAPARRSEFNKGTSVSSSKGKYLHGAGGFRHPRDSARGLDRTMGFLWDEGKTVVAHKKNSQAPLSPKPGMPENPYGAGCSGEQVSINRQALRRADYFLNQHKDLRLKENTGQDVPLEFARNRSSNLSAGRYEKPWPRLEQAVKTVDLLLHGGGFGAVVLDLGSIPWTDARRISLTTWFRFRRAVENTSTVLIVLAEDSCAKTCASLVLNCRRSGEEWARAASAEHVYNRATLAGFAIQVEVLRSRAQTSIALQSADLQSGKPVRSVYSGAEFGSARSAHWRMSTLWTG